MSMQLLTYSLCPPCHRRLYHGAEDGDDECLYCAVSALAMGNDETVCIMCSVVTA